jgi:hypothetical protein
MPPSGRVVESLSATAQFVGMEGVEYQVVSGCASAYNLKSVNPQIGLSRTIMMTIMFIPNEL